jgi:hypothetical protein
VTPSLLSGLCVVYVLRHRADRLSLLVALLPLLS